MTTQKELTSAINLADTIKQAHESMGAYISAVTGVYSNHDTLAQETRACFAMFLPTIEPAKGTKQGNLGVAKLPAKLRDALEAALLERATAAIAPYTADSTAENGWRVGRQSIEMSAKNYGLSVTIVSRKRKVESVAVTVAVPKPKPESKPKPEPGTAETAETETAAGNDVGELGTMPPISADPATVAGIVESWLKVRGKLIDVPTIRAAIQPALDAIAAIEAAESAAKKRRQNRAKGKKVELSAVPVAGKAETAAESETA